MCAASAVFLLPTILMGMTFSHLAQSACGKKGGLGRALSVNTVGAAIAPFFFGVVLLPAIGLKAALALVALGYLMLVPMPASRVQWMTSLSSSRPLRACPFSALIPEVCDGAIGWKGVGVRGRRDGGRLGGQATRAGMSTSKSTTTTRWVEPRRPIPTGDRPTSHCCFTRRQNGRSFWGSGTGATFAAAAEHPGLEVVGVELVPEVIDMLPHFERVTGKLDRNPRLEIKVADARRYINADRSSYDVIVADLFHPSRDGAGYLYTLEHFQAVKQRLAPGGVFCQWLPLYQLDMGVLKTIVRTFLQVFPEASAFLAHYSLTNPILGLVGGSPVIPTEAGWFDQRIGQEILKGRLNDLQLKNIYEFLGCYLAGAKDLSKFAGPGPLNTDDHPVVMFEAPCFVYSEQEPAFHRLLALIDALAPRTADVLPAANDWEGQEIHERLAKYWAARNRFIHAGVGVPRTRDVRELLSYVREPLLDVVRMSPDFDLAYRPLLAMAQNLVRIKHEAGKSLLASLADANPARSEAQILLNNLPSGREFSPDTPVQ